MPYEAGKRRRLIGLLFFLFALLILLLTISDAITGSGNESSRLAVVQSLVDQGTFAIDKSIFRTVDAGKLNGHFYSDKPIIFSAWLAAIYALIKNVWMIAFRNSGHTAIYLINLLGVSSLTLALYALFRQRLERVNGNNYLKEALAFSLIFCTWIFSYTVSINNHTVAAFLVFLLFLLTEKYISKDIPLPKTTAFCAGLAGGLLCAVENPVGGIFSLAAICCIIFCSGERRGTGTLLFFIGGLIPAITMAVLDYCGWGNILPVYLIKDAYSFKGNIHSTDFAGLRHPENYLSYFFNITLGSRGLFSHMPFLLLFIPALLLPKRHYPKGALGFFLGACGATLLFYALFTGDYGGWAYGFRFLIPIIPILYLVICQWLLQEPGKRWLKVAYPLLAVGLISSAIGAYNPWPVCYEGASTNKKSIDTRIESPLKANLLCLQYELSGKKDFSSNLYDAETIKYYLPKAFMNMRRYQKPTATNPNFVQPRRLQPFIVFMSDYLLPLMALLLFSGSILYLAGRAGFMLFPGEERITRVYIFYATAMTLLTMVTVLSTGIAGILQPYCLMALPLVPALWILVKHPGPILMPKSIKFRKEYLILLPALLFIVIRLAASLPLTPNDWDAMTYHLFIPLRWMHAGEIFHVPTVFGDNAAAYAPKNGSLIYAAVMTLMHQDFILNCLGMVYLIFCACSIYEICRELKLSSRSSLITSGLFAMCPFISDKAFSADVDIMALAFLLGGVLFLLKIIRRNEFDIQTKQSLYMSAVCLGLAVGVKTAYAPFGGIPAVLLLFLALKRGWFKESIMALGAMFIGGGFWYIWNLAMYGSPLFPAEVAFGPIQLFKGAYGTDALKAGEFYISGLPELLRHFNRDCSFLTGLFIVAGTTGIIWFSTSRRGRDSETLILASMTVAWLLVYYYIIPHNQQMRFLFPALALCFIGTATIIDRLSFKAAITVFGIAVLIYSGSNAARILHTLRGFPRIPMIWNLILLLIALWLVFQYRKRRYNLHIALLLLTLLFISAMRESSCLRMLSLVKGDYGLWAKIYSSFNSPQQTRPLRIAYTGLNIPYTLTGTGLKNEVFYCNVDGNQQDGFYEFWSKDPKRYPYHKPGIYRKKPDAPKWLNNLFDSGADALVVFEMHPAERAYLACGKDGYPIEKYWADSLPQFFKLELSLPGGRVYRIVPPTGKNQDHH